MASIVTCNNKLSYQEWYDKVWKKWKDVGYVTKSKLIQTFSISSISLRQFVFREDKKKF